MAVAADEEEDYEMLHDCVLSRNSKPLLVLPSTSLSLWHHVTRVTWHLQHPQYFFTRNSDRTNPNAVILLATPTNYKFNRQFFGSHPLGLTGRDLTEMMRKTRSCKDSKKNKVRMSNCSLMLCCSHNPDMKPRTILLTKTNKSRFISPHNLRWGFTLAKGRWIYQWTELILILSRSFWR